MQIFFLLFVFRYARLTLKVYFLCCHNLSSVCLLHFNNLTFLLLSNISRFKNVAVAIPAVDGAKVSKHVHLCSGPLKDNWCEQGISEKLC